MFDVNVMLSSPRRRDIGHTVSVVVASSLSRAPSVVDARTALVGSRDVENTVGPKIAGTILQERKTLTGGVPSWRGRPGAFHASRRTLRGQRTRSCCRDPPPLPPDIAAELRPCRYYKGGRVFHRRRPHVRGGYRRGVQSWE